MIKSYLMAVSASCSVALGLNSVVPRLAFLSKSTKLVLERLVPFAAVASAGALNVFLMRGEEIRQGIDVYPFSPSLCDVDDKSVNQEPVASLGKSQKAATIAVAETAISRVITSTPVMVLPPLLLLRFQKMGWLKKRPFLVMPINIGQLRSHIKKIAFYCTNTCYSTGLPHFCICPSTCFRGIPTETDSQLGCTRRQIP